MGRARGTQHAVGGFQSVMGTRRGRADRDNVASTAPSATAAADAQRLSEPANEPEALALIGAYGAQLHTRPLLRELAQTIASRHAERQLHAQGDRSKSIFVSLGVRSQHSDVLVRPDSGRGKLHIWPQGAELGPWVMDWEDIPLKRTLCGKPMLDIVGPGTRRVHKFSRAGAGFWQASSEGKRCPECAKHADEYEDTRYLPATAPALPERHMQDAQTMAEARLISEFRAGHVDVAELAPGAFREALCAAAGAYCQQQGERALQAVGPSNSWNNLRRMLARELSVSEAEVTARALATLSAQDWSELIAAAAPADEETGQFAHQRDRSALWVGLAKLVRARLDATSL